MRILFHIILFVCVSVMTAFGEELIAEQHFIATPAQQTLDLIETSSVDDISYGEIIRASRTRTPLNENKFPRYKSIRRNILSYKISSMAYATGKIIDYNSLTNKTRHFWRLPMASKSCYEFIIRIGKLISEP